MRKEMKTQSRRSNSTLDDVNLVCLVCPLSDCFQKSKECLQRAKNQEKERDLLDKQVGSGMARQDWRGLDRFGLALFGPADVELPAWECVPNANTGHRTGTTGIEASPRKRKSTFSDNDQSLIRRDKNPEGQAHGSEIHILFRRFFVRTCGKVFDGHPVGNIQRQKSSTQKSPTIQTEDEHDPYALV